MTAKVSLAAVVGSRGVRFGTSGVRGLVSDLTDQVAWAYVAAFLADQRERGELGPGAPVLLGGDRRPSTPRLLAAAAQAIRDAGAQVAFAGLVPTPALLLASLERAAPSVMVTGSHIPFDRNGLKFATADGEIGKADEARIQAAQLELPDTFDASGAFRVAPAPLPAADAAVSAAYVDRFRRAFAADCLAGLRVGLYGHSAVGRDLLAALLAAFGAEVVRLGDTDDFVPIDTEALRPEDEALARRWAREERLDALVSTDGDGDRPLMADEQGAWLRGDVLGVLTAKELGADAVATPVSSSSSLERCGAFGTVWRTRIGSPYVVAALGELQVAGHRAVVGFEANGGFLIQSPLALAAGTLSPLPTRDPVVVMLATLGAARRRGVALSALVAELPARFTASDRLTDVPAAASAALVARLSPGEAEALLALPAPVVAVDRTDGVRMTLADERVVHVRPSGNAPELRVYTEAASDEEARALCAAALAAVAREVRAS